MAIITNVYLHKHYQKTKTFCCHVSYYLTLSEVGSFCRKKLNMSRLVALRLVQIKQTCSFEFELEFELELESLEGRTLQDTLSCC